MSLNGPGAADAEDAEEQLDARLIDLLRQMRDRHEVAQAATSLVFRAWSSAPEGAALRCRPRESRRAHTYHASALIRLVWGYLQ